MGGDLLTKYNVTIPDLVGRNILAKVVKLSRSKVLLDPGYYSFCLIDRDELGLCRVFDAKGQALVKRSADDVRQGDHILVEVRLLHTPFGRMEVGPPQAEKQRFRTLIWKELQEAYEQDRSVYGRVLNVCKGGYAVGVAGYVALLPFSRCSVHTAERIGQLQLFTIHSLDEQTYSIVLNDPSHKSFAPSEDMYSNI